jgi:putative FmdB family regulatory protein
MPTYPYTCEQCGEFEIVKSMVDSSRRERCPKCGMRGVRVFGRIAVKIMACDKAINHAWSARNDAVQRSDKFQSRVKSGELEPLPARKHYSLGENYATEELDRAPD